jgi:hypothetical protein
MTAEDVVGDQKHPHKECRNSANIAGPGNYAPVSGPGLFSQVTDFKDI